MTSIALTIVEVLRPFCDIPAAKYWDKALERDKETSLRPGKSVFNLMLLAITFLLYFNIDNCQ